MEEAMVDGPSFQLLVEGAADAGLFGVWPFRGSSVSSSNVTTANFYLPDIIHACSHMQRLNEIFPYLSQLFVTPSARTLHPNNSPALHEALTLLAEAYDMPSVSEETQYGIRHIMGQWDIMRVPTGKSVGVWSSQPQPSRICSDKKETLLWVVGALQQQRPSACDCSPAAAMQLVSATHTAPAKAANAPQVCARSIVSAMPQLVHMSNHIVCCLTLALLSNDKF